MPSALKPSLYASLLVAMVMGGCLADSPNTPPSSPSHRLPEWVYETSKEGKIGGVGISKPHIDGLTAQRNLAISRALDEIARQMGVKVLSLQKTTRSGTSDSASSSLESYSFHTTDGQNIRARIQTFWENRATDELYVWMVVE
ncbi:MAG: hypothetical protein PHW64_04285 [Sulfuricurvum sp.]|nr:hypothetical protein [Sulfuricurvum sp.]